MTTLWAASLQCSCISDTVVNRGFLAASIGLPALSTCLQASVAVLNNCSRWNRSVNQGPRNAYTFVTFRTRFSKIQALLERCRRHDMTALRATSLQGICIAHTMMDGSQLVASVGIPSRSTCLQAGIAVFDGNSFWHWCVNQRLRYAVAFGARLHALSLRH